MTGPSKSKKTDYLHQGRKDRLLKEMDHDPYHSKRKIPEPSVCSECGAVFHKGRWSWDEREANAHEVLCPACQRIMDRVPAGFLTISGDFFTQHREELMNLIHNMTEKEGKEHPLQRLMGIEEQEASTVFTFTDAHLTRGIGEALHRAYEGELDFEYTKEDIMLRVSWHR